MENYVSPVIFDNDELAEGVYATGSGAGDCWTMTYEEKQRVNNNPGDNFVVYRIDAVHHVTGVFHISRSTTIFVNFSGAGITGVQVEGTDGVCMADTGVLEVNKGEDGFKIGCTSSGCTIVRHYHGNAYESGDNFNIMLRINSPDGEAVVTGITWECEKVENVQDTARPNEDDPNIGDYYTPGNKEE